MKCLADLDGLSGAARIDLSLSDGLSNEVAQRSSSLIHDFAKNGVFVCKTEWDFARAVDDESQMFVVRLILQGM